MGEREIINFIPFMLHSSVYFTTLLQNRCRKTDFFLTFFLMSPHKKYFLMLVPRVIWINQDNKLGCQVTRNRKSSIFVLTNALPGDERKEGSRNFTDSTETNSHSSDLKCLTFSLLLIRLNSTYGAMCCGINQRFIAI